MRLMLDYDGERGWDAKSIIAHHTDVRNLIWSMGLRVVSVDALVSSGGDGLHVVMEARGRWGLRGRCRDATTVALQACLGSDPRREMHNIDRIHGGWGRGWNRLWEGKAGGARVSASDLTVALRATWGVGP